MAKRQDRIRTELEYWDDKVGKDNFVDEYIIDKDVSLSACISAIIQDGVKGPVLEVGCGIGRLTSEISKLFPTILIFGIDISPKMIAYAAKTGRNNCVYTVCDGRGIPREMEFGFVYSMVVFQHIDADGVKEYIKNISKRLYQGGIFRFQYVEGIGSDGIFSNKYLFKDIKEWLEDAGLRVVKANFDFICPDWTWVTAIKK